MRRCRRSRFAGLRYVPVVKDGRLTGIDDIGEVFKSRMSELEFDRDHPDSYLHSGQS